MNTSFQCGLIGILTLGPTNMRIDLFDYLGEISTSFGGTTYCEHIGENAYVGRRPKPCVIASESRLIKEPVGRKYSTN